MHTVKVLAYITMQYPQSVYIVLRMMLQAGWQHLSRTVLRVEDHLQPNKDALWGKFIPALIGLAEMEVNGNMRALFANSVK